MDFVTELGALPELDRLFSQEVREADKAFELQQDLVWAKPQLKFIRSVRRADTRLGFFSRSLLYGNNIIVPTSNAIGLPSTLESFRPNFIHLLFIAILR